MHRQRIKVNLRQILSANLYYPDRSFFLQFFIAFAPLLSNYSRFLRETTPILGAPGQR